VTTRKARGDGKLYQRNSGRDAGKWVRAIWVTDPVTGGSRYKSFTGKTPKEAAGRARDYLKEHGEIAPTASQMTVATMVRRFVSGYEMQVLTGARRPNTLGVLRLCQGKIEKDPIGRMPVSKLQARDVDAMVSRMLAGGFGRQKKVSPRYAQLVRATLGRALARAVRDGYAVRNVVAESQPVHQTPPTRKALTDEQIGAMLGAAKARGPQAYALVAVLFGLAARRGEILGLRWSDIDWNNEKPTILVERQVKRENGQVVVGPLKTAASRRRLRVPDYVMVALEALREEGEPGKWVFESRAGTPLDPSNAYHLLQRIGKEAGIDNFRPHDARHSALTMLARSGIGPAQIQAFAGHADPKVALSVYTHLDVSDLDGCADALDRF
jgi:integrase